MMAQYLAIKREHPDAILFYRMGDFYEMFHDDAREAARLLGITLTSRQKGENAIPMAGVPVRAAQNYLVRLIRAGKRVAVCEQVEDPREAKGLVDRKVVRIVTPGTLTEEGVLDDRSPNHLAALCRRRDRAGLAWLDLSTGAFLITEVEPEKVPDELGRIEPAELLLPENRDGEVEEALPFLRDVPLRRCPSFDFDTDSASRDLREFFGTRTLEGFGIDPERMPAAVAAAGALLRYVQETQRTTLGHIRRLRVFQRGNRMLLDRATRRSLELVRTQRDGGREGSLLHHIDRTKTPMGARLMRDRLLAPFKDLTPILRAQEGIAECVEKPSLRAAIREALARIQDLERLTARLCTGRANARDLVGLRQSFERLPALGDHLASAESEILKERGASWDDLSDLASRIAACLVDEPPVTLREGGLIREGFDPELDELRSIGREGKDWIARFQADEIERTGLANLRIGFNKVFGYYIELPRSTDPALVPARYVRKQTIKNAERYVTQELKEFETKVLKSEEMARDLEYNLFSALREDLAAGVARILDASEAVAEVDFVTALAEIAVERAWCRPVVDESLVLRIRDGRHPVLEAALEGEPFVPNDTELDPPERSLVILTGPNMAGKSTWIRQNALLVLLAQIGSFVPAREARIGLVDRIFTRVGAADDIARGSSTFMVEMTETANILHHARRRSLVILDEVGRGTSTYDGLSLAWAICEALHEDLGCRTLFATHYHQMTAMAGLFRGIHNQHVAVREWGDEIVFLHRIQEGGTDKSYGLHVARLAGIGRNVLERAEEILLRLEEEGEALKPGLVRRGSRPRMRQLELFRPPSERLLDELSKLDPDNLSPMDALLKLRELKEKFAGGDSPSP